jgi:hypothetical protein
MSRVHAALIVTLVMALGAARAVPEPREGAFGGVLDARTGALVTPGDARYGETPLTVVCRVKLFDHAQYNILLAHETKDSGTHWELFTMPGTGTFHVYVPGCVPDHVHTGVPIVDGEWHEVTMVLEETQIRLFVDGVEHAREAVTRTGRTRVPGPLTIGGLVEGGYGCAGLVDEARISAGVTPGGDDATLASWSFAEGELGKDASGREKHGELRATGTVYTSLGVEIPGGMSTDFQSLPEPEDVAPLREALTELAARAQLASIAASAMDDRVLRQWSHDFAWEGKTEYPEHRPGGPDDEKLRREVYDAHALVHDADGGPVGTVLRRTQALLESMDGAPASPDLDTLRAIWEAGTVVPGSDEEKVLYLAVCAVRRQLMLSNPLLDFDTLLCVVRGTFEGSVRSNPQTSDAQGGHFVTQYFGFNALPGGGIYLIRNYTTQPEIVDVLADAVVQNGRMKGQKLDHGAFATPDLSYDGKTIVFAWTANAEHQWIYSRDKSFHLFRVNADGTNLVQLTDGAYNDFDPCWLPDGRIAFVSERRGGYIRCFAANLKVRSYTLFSMRHDGSDIVPLSYFETSEWNPSVNNEGQLVFTRWDYVDRENCLGTRFWISGPDGSDPRAPHGNYPLPYHTFPDHTPWKVAHGRTWDSRFGAPLVEIGIRAVPDSPLYLFTAAPHHGSVYGSLAMLDLRVEDDSHMSQIKRVTPYEPFPETEMPGRRHYRFGTPWPLSEDLYLTNEWENLVLLDRFGNKELLCGLRDMPCAPDERLRIIDPIPLRARPRPSALPPKQKIQEDGTAAPATVAIMDVYNSDLPFPEDTQIKWLRVVQNIPKTNHAMGEPMIGYERENTPRIPLGVVPVEEDGSVYFEAPVAKQLIFQVLDEDFMAVQSMRSAAFVHPGEQLSCLGCHENPQAAARRDMPPLAMQRPPSKLQPECGPVEPVSYYRQIKPIFEQRCMPCHVEEGAPLQDMAYDNLKEDYTFWFSGAMFTDMTTAYSGVHGGSRTIPGRFGARASKIGQALFDETHAQAVSPEDRHQIIQWLDCNSLRLGAYIHEEAQLRGELVWPTLDVDPENVIGVENASPGLRGNFWHQNTYGPYPVLISEHANDRIAMLDEAGDIVWSYAVPHPQDVWMLENGNILTTYAQGVREITPQKETVWEFTTEKPNEIPTCQPLPNGNVLIGIVGECRLIEVNRQGETVLEIPLSTTETTPHAQFRLCRKTPEGTYLVPFTAEGAVREYDAEGTVIREFPRRPTPVCALRLDNGNTLISADGALTEYDRNNAIVWDLRQHDIPDIQIGTFAGIQRLDNGNTIVCNWDTRDTGAQIGAHIFEVTHDKRVVWQVTGGHIGQVAQCQLLPETAAMAR